MHSSDDYIFFDHIFLSRTYFVWVFMRRPKYNIGIYQLNCVY